jgi:hypothetical protein
MHAISERGIEALVAPDGNMREGKRPGWENGVYELMRRKLSTERGRKLYAQRDTVGWPGGIAPPGSLGSRRDSLPSPGSSHRPVSTRGPTAIGRLARAPVAEARSTTVWTA